MNIGSTSPTGYNSFARSGSVNALILRRDYTAYK
jgi:hypothetical protein